MVRECFICRRQSGEFITLLSFPEIADIKKQWATFCKTQIEDLRKSDRLCSLHFDPSAFKNPFTNTGKRFKLKTDAVPTIFDALEISLSTVTQNNEKANKFGRCCLCGVLSSKITRFTFPLHDPETTEKWLAVCGNKKQDLNVNCQRVCMKHFNHDDFLERSNEKQRFLLKPGAVPLFQLENTNYRNENLEKPRISAQTGNEDEVEESCPFEIHSNDATMYLHQTEVALTVVDNSEKNETSENASSYNIPDTLPGGLLLETPRSTKSIHALSETTAGSLPLPRTPTTTQITLKRKYPRYLNDLNTPDCGGLKKAKMILDVARRDVARSRQHSRKLAQKNRRLHKKVMTMEKTIKELKDQKFLSEQSLSDIVGNLPPSMEAILKRHLSEAKGGEYPEEIKNFAISVNFYSAQAYSFLRLLWGKKSLPHPSRLRHWYSSINGEPGFTSEAFNALKTMTCLYGNKNVICNIVMDEMSVKKSVSYNDTTGKASGYVSFGVPVLDKDDTDSLATHISVIMAVSLNSNWKVPLGHFAVNSFNGQQKKNILTICLEKLHQIDVKVASVTFDGVSSNFTMCTLMGANLDFGSSKFQTWFPHPATKEPVYIFPDPCHMLKNVRNAFGDRGPFQDDQNRIIKWQYINNLHQLQQNENLHAANKITSRHINYNENKMSVRLAAQTLSHSVRSSLLFLQNIKNPDFANAEGTANFCEVFDDVFDILNCRNQFSKKSFCIPLRDDTAGKLKIRAEELISYITKLRYVSSGQFLIDSGRKAGFIGFIICLRNIFSLFEQLKKWGMTYLLTYKLLQDAIENFFSAVRARGGFNNNPTCKQFEAAYKRLLVHFELTNCRTNTNCSMDTIQILKCGKSVTQLLDVPPDNVDPKIFSSDDAFLKEMLNESDHLMNNIQLSEYSEKVIQYIGGYIVKRLQEKLSCGLCRFQLESSDSHYDPTSLIHVKTKGFLINPNYDVVKICKATEKIFRENISHLKKLNFKKKVQLAVREMIGNSIFDNAVMDDHIMHLDFLSDHRQQLVDAITSLYIKLRRNHEAKKIYEPKKYIRRKFSRLILFNNQ